MFGAYVHALTGAAIGLLFPAGREVYRRSYLKDPSTRTAGSAVSGISTVVLLLGSLVGAVISWL
jgi:hypothetical protein